MLDLEGAALRLEALLPQQVGCRIDQQVLLGQTAQIPCRLIAERVPEPVAEQRRERLLETARRRQEAVREAAWDLADWTLYLTNATPDLLDAQACLMLGRYRWQIELLFKLWKSGLQLAQSRSDHPWRILCEIYAKLIAVIVQHWLLLVGCWQQPDRSLWQASVSVQRYAWAIAAFLQRPGLLTALLQQLRQSMIPCRIESYRSRPASAQRLADLVA